LRALATVAFVVVLVAFRVGDALAVATPPGSIAVTITGFRSDRGRAFVALWRSAEGFPGTPPASAPSRTVVIEHGRAHARFDNVDAGVFAITVFHDEDGDTELKESFFGIPKEGIGFSRDVRPRFRAPRFEEARLELSSGTLKLVPIKMLYL
jgi:uncharacterized protein (DUF2141 family)